MRRRALLSSLAGGLGLVAGCQRGTMSEPTVETDRPPRSPTPPPTPIPNGEHETGTIFDGEATGTRAIPASIDAGQRLTVDVPDLGGADSLFVAASHSNVTYARFRIREPGSRTRPLVTNPQRVAIRMVARSTGNGDPTVPVTLRLSEQQTIPETVGILHDGPVGRVREWLVLTRQAGRVQVEIDDLDDGEKVVVSWITPDGEPRPRLHVYEPRTVDHSLERVQGFGFVRVTPLRTERPLDEAASASVRVFAEPV